MKKSIVVPMLALTSFLMATEAPTNESRHGMSIGVDTSYSPSTMYDPALGLSTGSHMPSIHLGYLYEGPEGVCWNVSTKYFYKKDDADGKREAHHILADFRYRFIVEDITVAPIIGLKSEAYSLESNNTWLAHHAYIYAGLETIFKFNDTIAASLELKAKSSYLHYLVYDQNKYLYSTEKKNFYGIEIDVPVRINISDDRKHELEIRPYYHYAAFEGGQHKAGIQVQTIYWF